MRRYATLSQTAAAHEIRLKSGRSLDWAWMQGILQLRTNNYCRQLCFYLDSVQCCKAEYVDIAYASMIVRGGTTSALHYAHVMKILMLAYCERARWLCGQRYI